jgi:hypothetical protein
MAISVKVQNNFQIIVPVRVDRAVRGAPQLDAPDVDDRGWVNNRAAGLNVDDARGSLFGTTVGDVIRLKVVREDLDAGVPLFVSVTGNQVAIAQPAGGGPLPADGIFSVRSVADTATGSKIQVHLGVAGGPVICEADAHAFTPSTLKITPHVCTIHSAAQGEGKGVPPTVGGNVLDDAQIATIFRIVEAIWRPAGVQFAIAAPQQEVYAGFLADDFASQNRGGVSEENIVISRRQAARRCNIYFIRFMDQSLGVGVNADTRAGERLTRSGIIIGVEGSSANNQGGGITRRSSAGADLVHEIGNDVAHEIGHFLTLNHADNVNAVAATPNGRTDTYNRRFLMHPINLLPTAVNPLTANSVPRFDDIGYGVVGGRGHRGCLITLKDHPSHTSDGEVVAARRRLGAGNLYD